MKFDTVSQLPKYIKERRSLELVDAIFVRMSELFSLSDEKREKLYRLIDEIILGKKECDKLIEYLHQDFGYNDVDSKKIALFLWMNYFSLFQDIIGNVRKNIDEHGGDAAIMEAHVRTILSPHATLIGYADSLFSDAGIDEVSHNAKNELIDMLLSYAQEKISTSDARTQLNTLIEKYHFQTNIDDFIGFVQYLISIGDLSAEKADYYSNLSENVLHAHRHILLVKEMGEAEKKPVNTDAILFKKTSEQKKDETSEKIRLLPDELQRLVASEEFNKKVSEFEKKHNLFFKEIIIAVIIKDVRFEDLALAINKKNHLGPEKSSALRDEIIKTFFEPVMWYFTGEQKPGTETTKLEPVVTSEKPVVMPEQPKQTQQQQEKQQETRSQIEPSISVGQVEMTLSEAPKVEPRHFDTYEELASLVIQKCITGLNEECRTRVQRALITRIRNIRTNIETAEKLIDAQHEGGCGITPEIAERAVKEAASLAQAMQERKIFVGPQMPIEKIEAPVEMQIEPEQQAPKKEEPLPVSAPTPLPQEPLKEESKEVIPPPLELPPIPEPMQPPPPPESTAKPPLPLTEQTIPKSQPPPSPKPKLTPVAPPSPPSLVTSPEPQAPATLSIEDVDGIPTLVEKSATISPLPKPISQPPLQPVQKQETQTLKVEVRKTQSSSEESKKLSISDVKKAPHLVGPIEELQTFSLKDFRRISANPVQAANRIFDKIQSLEKESLPKKMEAIDAWKRSEVNQLYIEIGKESFGKGVPIAQAIEQRKNIGKEYLSEQEFDALLDLSTMLRS